MGKITLSVSTFSESNIVLGDISTEYTRSYDTRYCVTIMNTYINERRELKDLDTYGLKLKIEKQFKVWAEKEERNKLREHNAASKELAESKTKECQRLWNDISDILNFTLSIDDTVNWDELKDKSKFTIVNPVKQLKKAYDNIKDPTPPIINSIPEEPLRSDDKYIPKYSLIDKLISSRKEKKDTKCNALHVSDHDSWEKQAESINILNKKNEEDYQERVKLVSRKREKALEEISTAEEKWNKEKEKFYTDQKKHNDQIDLQKEKYLQGEESAVEDYCELVLNRSVYPDVISKNFDIDYNRNNKIILVEYDLPSIDAFPSVKEYKFIQSKSEMKEILMTESEKNKIYESTLYNITLRTIHELFEADTANALLAVNFNGWVNRIDKATGNEIRNCIISIQAQKEEFLTLNLAQIESKACFKSLKGISSSKLAATTPIQPIVQISKEDKRFIEGRNIVDQTDDSTNLAAMNWDDFEHLIRELFEKEFTINGGEVKVTQASRDGGVDAVAFDPDPIRGGKIVIQAKRYTNTVGVSAVRDLYGTVMNEGATKGILVTTSDYGPDAYSFAQSKPLTLLNGANLVYLLEKHGHRAKIDINEARMNAK
jgi:restriction system protein